MACFFETGGIYRYGLMLNGARSQGVPKEVYNAMPSVNLVNEDLMFGEVVIIPKNVKGVYYDMCKQYRNIEESVTREELLRNDGLGVGNVDVPVLKQEVIDIIQEYAGDKIQVLDTVITLQNGEEIYDYKALNVLHTIKAAYFIDGDTGCYKKADIEREVIGRCDDMKRAILICRSLRLALQRRKFKGLRFRKTYAYSPIVDE